MTHAEDSHKIVELLPIRQSPVELIGSYPGFLTPTTMTFSYVEADLTMMETAVGKLAPADIGPARFKPGDQLLAFLTAL